jgi:hypothetical protein
LIGIQGKTTDRRACWDTGTARGQPHPGVGRSPPGPEQWSIPVNSSSRFKALTKCETTVSEKLSTEKSLLILIKEIKKITQDIYNFLLSRSSWLIIYRYVVSGIRIRDDKKRPDPA